MPGIAGVISPQSAVDGPRVVQAMLASMKHEPDYESGLCAVPELGIHAGWTAHPGSFAAMHSGNYQDDSITLIFSGECFRTDPERSPTPANWIVQSYLELGEEFIASLNGLFSGLLIDRRRKMAFLFNERYGIERLYFHQAEGAVYFASEAKALLRVLPELRTFSDAGVAQFLAYGCTLDGQTLFKGIALAPGGTQWTIGPGTGLRKLRYFSPEQWESQTALTVEEFDEAFSATFTRILPKYAGTGRGLGISLTGGLDSRMVMACLPATTDKPVCYTFSSGNPRFLDARIAASIATTCGLTHHELVIGDDFLRQFQEHLDRTVYISDGCAGALGAHEIYLNAKGRQLAPIRLTGNYGSEVLRAVSTFKPLHLAPGLLAADWHTRIAQATNRPADHAAHPVTFSAFREVPWSLFGTLAAGRSQVTFRTPFLDNELVALAYRTPNGQRTSPIPALRLVQRSRPSLAAIPTDRGVLGESRGPAFQMRRLFAEVTFKLDYLHKEGLPSALSPFAPLLNALDHTGLLGLHKFLAYRRWFQKDLAPQISAVLTDPRTCNASFWERKFLATMLDDHSKGRQNYVREINAVLTLEAVDRLLLRGYPT